MGYGEVGGGGSVLWRIRHKGNGQGEGHARGGKGRDPIPEPGTNGEFWVVIDGKPYGPFPIDHKNRRQIQIVWTPDTPDDLRQLEQEADEEEKTPGRPL